MSIDDGVPTMRRFGSILLLTIGLMAGSQSLLAQELGERVRVTVADGVVSTGQIWALTDDSIDLLLGDGLSRSFAHADITMIERSLGRKRQWKKGLLYGGGLGAAVGVVKVLVSGYETCPGGGLCLGGEHRDADLTSVLAFGIGFGAVGALYGGGVGALFRREQWETTPHANPIGFALSPVIGIRPSRDGDLTSYWGLRVQF